MLQLWAFRSITATHRVPMRPRNLRVRRDARSAYATAENIHGSILADSDAKKSKISAVPYKNLEPVSRQLVVLLGLSIIGLMAFSLVLSYYKNAMFDLTLQGIADQNDALRDQIAQSERELLYVNSTQFKDKYAKEYLGKVRPGEKVLIIPPSTGKQTYGDPTPLGQWTAAQEAAYLELLRQMPVYEHWTLFLFKRGAIEELKKSV